MKTQRNATFDIAKCLAMYLVVLGHIIADKTGDPAYFINLLHLPVLFFISGYFSVGSVEKRAAGELVKRKTASLLVPYLIWSGIALAANSALMVLRGALSLEVLLNEAVQIFVFARSVWFLIQLFFTFLFFLALYKLVKATGMQRFALAIYLLIWLLLYWLLPNDLLAFHKFKWLFPFFLCGYYAARHREKLAEWLNNHRNASALAWLSAIYPLLVAILVQLDGYHSHASFSYNSPQSILACIGAYLTSGFGVLLVMKISNWISRYSWSNYLAQIGTYSMDIYVIHMFLIKFIPIPLDLKALNPVAVWIVLGAVTLVIVLAIWLFSKFVLRRMKSYCLSVGIN